MADGDIAIKAGLGGGIFFIAVVSIVLNILAVIVYYKKKRLHGDPTKYFLLNLAIVDLVAVYFWTSFTVISIISLEWTLPDGLCKFQAYFMHLCVLLNMHTFIVLAFERFLLFQKPSRHDEIFINSVVTILLSSLWFFDGLISAFPLMFNWGEISYFKNQYQCAMDYEKNSRQMNFMLNIAFVIPLLTVIVFNIFIMIRLKILKNRSTPGTAIITEKNNSRNGDSYAARLRKQNIRFQNAGTKNKKPKMEKKIEYTNNGYISNSDTNSSGDEENLADAVKIKDKKPLKKPFHLSKSDVTLSRTYLFITILYVLLWLPYIVISYITTYTNTAVSDEVVTAFVIMTHCVSFIKPVVYVLFNANLRKFMKGTFCKKKNRSYSSGSASNVDFKVQKDDFPNEDTYSYGQDT